MKVAQLSEILASIAKNHPDADVVVTYPARHAGRPTSRHGNISGYRVTVSSHPVVRPKLWIQLDDVRGWEEQTKENSDE